MSAWTDALTDQRIAEAKEVFFALQKIGWNDLSRCDKRLMQALGYLCLERDDVSLAGLADADLGDQDAGSEARSDARNQDPEGPYDQQSEVE